MWAIPCSQKTITHHVAYVHVHVHVESVITHYALRITHHVSRVCGFLAPVFIFKSYTVNLHRCYGTQERTTCFRQ